MTKEKLLVIPGYKIYPIDSGGAHMQLTFLEKQQHQFDLHLILSPDNINAQDIPAFAKRFPLIKLVPIGFAIKKPKGVGAFFKKQVRKVSGKDFSYLMRKVQHVNGYFISNPPLIDALSAYVNNNHFDLIQVEHLRNAGLVFVLPKNVKKIFVQHEVGFLRVYDDLKSLGYPVSYAAYLSGFAEGAEIYYIQQYDGVITFNKDDAELLRSKGVQVPSHVSSPFALFDDELSKVYKPKNKPQLLFIGGEEHFPNKEGLTWFLAQIFPGVLKNNSNLKLFVTSRWSDEYKNKYKSNNVVFTGFVDNLDELMSSSILVTPIRIGSGIRVKVFTSMAKGLPVVSTTLGASGIPELEHYKNILLADDETEFAACINNVVKNENLRQEISNGAYNLSSKSFAAMQFVEERNKFYRQIVQKS